MYNIMRQLLIVVHLYLSSIIEESKSTERETDRDQFY